MSEHYSADQLQLPVQIIRRALSDDGAGGQAETESTLPSPSTYHMAAIRPLRGLEREVNNQIVSDGGVLFVMWAAVEVLTTDVILYAGTRYNVTRAAPPGLSQFREVEASSGGPT